MLRAVFVDMDDTFVGPDKTIPGDNLRVLDLANEKGVRVVPCTGRSVAGLPPELAAHPSVRYAVCGGGALVYDVRAGRPVRESVIDPGTVRALFKEVRPLRTSFDLFTSEGIFTAEDRWPVLEEIDVNDAFRRMLVGMRTRVPGTTDELIARLGGICRINLFFLDELGRDGVWDAVAAHPDLTCVSSLPFNVELTRAGTNKGSGLRCVCELLGIEASDVVAFGDSGNDVSMLEAAGDGVAMGNASPEALAAADHVTARCEEAGVARYLEPLLEALPARPVAASVPANEDF